MIGGPFLYLVQFFSTRSFMRRRQSFMGSRFMSAVGAFLLADGAVD